MPSSDQETQAGAVKQAFNDSFINNSFGFRQLFLDSNLSKLAEGIKKMQQLRAEWEKRYPFLSETAKGTIGAPDTTQPDSNKTSGGSA